MKTEDCMNDGGPAFPEHEVIKGWLVPVGGMSLRDYFAGQALMVLGKYPRVMTEVHDSDKDIANACYRLADAMLSERDKK